MASIKEHTEQTAIANPRRKTMLVAVAYSEAALPSLQLARSSSTIRKIGVILFILLALTIVIMACAPWQQNVKGTGSVLAYSPDERQQTIEAPIKGMVTRWGDGITENSRVEKGQLIAEIEDLDETYKSQLARKLEFSTLGAKAARDRLENYKFVLEAADKMVISYQGKYEAYQRVKEETIAAQDAYVRMAEKKVNAEKQQLLEYNAAIPQLQAEVERLAILLDEGNIALQKYQEVFRKLSESNAKVSRAEAYVESAEAELEGKRRERTAKVEKVQADIESAKAELDKAIGETSKAKGEINKAEEELNKATKEIVDAEVNLARQSRGIVTAPFDGFVVKIKPNFRTAVLKQGDTLCTIVPDTTDRSVQVYVDGNNAPLVEPGRHVRLQFEGWPAVQFAGWPSVAVGTFGGQVTSVDATDNGKGKFRVLIQPDENGEPWPEKRFLRQGVRANAWILLDTVPLWYEIWRQLNGFPPVVDIDEREDEKEEKRKPPKLPK